MRLMVGTKWRTRNTFIGIRPNGERDMDSYSQTGTLVELLEKVTCICGHHRLTHSKDGYVCFAHKGTTNPNDRCACHSFYSVSNKKAEGL
jgi:hypothetical protein